LASRRNSTWQSVEAASSGAAPVEQGFVSNLAHPGGNITGFANYEFSIAASHSHCAALPAGAMRPTSAQC
jgi:hypothetical protein